MLLGDTFRPDGRLAQSCAKPATMRELKHPIALFVGAVLVAVGVGVGVVAATQTQTVYGPSWGRFSVAFPSRVQEQSVRYMAQTAVAYDSSVIYEVQNPILHGRTAIEDHVSALHVSEDVSRHDLREMVRRQPGPFPLPLPSQHTEQVNGFLSLRGGPLCAQNLCEELLIVVRNRTMWVLWAISFLGLGPVENFVIRSSPSGSSRDLSWSD